MAQRTVVKSVPNAKLYSDGTILIMNGRLSYPNVLKPRAGQNESGQPTPPTYSCTTLMNKTTHTEAKNLIKAEIDRILKENKLIQLSPERLFLRNGNLSDKADYHGHFYVAAREQESRPPRVRGPDKSVWTAEKNLPLIFGGCWANMLIRPWFQNNKYGKRVNAGLSAVQFIRKDVAFGEGQISDEDIDETFDTVETEDPATTYDPSDVDDL